MPRAIDVRPLNAFFKEVDEQLHLKLSYRPDTPKNPIQVENATNELTKIQCNLLLEFIQGQVDLRENEIVTLSPSKIAGKVIFDITPRAMEKIAEVYALSLFYDAPEDDDTDAQ
jgi:hypothetical protein